MKQRHRTIRLVKMLGYMLGRCPHEFGLIGDKEGYFRIKDVIRCLGEEEGFKSVRRADIDEILLSGGGLFETDGQKIRVADRSALFRETIVNDPPKVLYAFVRQRAAYGLAEHGIRPTGADRVILSDKKEMIKRIALRYDKRPVICVVHTEKAIKAGIIFSFAGGNIFFADFIPPFAFDPPALPRQPEEPVKVKLKDPAGSFEMKPKKSAGHAGHSVKGRKKEISWKKERRKGKKRIDKLSGWS